MLEIRTIIQLFWMSQTIFDSMPQLQSFRQQKQLNCGGEYFAIKMLLFLSALHVIQLVTKRYWQKYTRRSSKTLVTFLPSLGDKILFIQGGLLLQTDLFHSCSKRRQNRLLFLGRKAFPPSKMVEA